MTSTGGTMRTDPGPDRVAGGNTQPPVVRLAELTHRYGDVLAADGVTLDIPGGSHVALVGESGAGKSSVAALLARLRDPDAGEIRLGGTSLKVYPAAGLADYFNGDNLVVINMSRTSRDAGATLTVSAPIGEVLKAAVP